jgi:broad-specificity NMP kinase
MNNTLTIYVGLPGSGKTTMAQAQITDLEKFGLTVRLFDDVAATKKGINELTAYLFSQETVHAIVTDIFGIEDHVRKAMMKQFYPLADIHWGFFANDPEACIVNVEARYKSVPVYAHKISPDFIRELSKHYTIPEGSVVIPVYSSIPE